MAYLDLTAMNAALKELYEGQVIENMVYKNNPFLAMVKKDTEFGGKYLPVPIIIGASQGRSATFTNAQTNQSAVVVDSFLLKRKSDYSIATIDNETMLASATDKMSFLNGSKLFIDGAIRSIKLSLASSLFRSGTGSIGQISTIVAGVITLVDRAQVVQFELNQTLQADATDGGVAPHAAVGYIVAVDRSAGTITVSGTMGGVAGSPAAWAPADYLLVQGDLNKKINGLAAWIPTVAPTAGDNFFGVDRSVDVVRLAGNRFDGSAMSIEEALIDAQSQAAENGATLDYGIMNYASYSALEKSLGSKVQYVDVKSGDIGFRGITINGAEGTINIFPDRNCPAKTCYLLQMDTWTLHSLGEAPQILKYGDGLEVLRIGNADAGEVRVGYYANLACNAPGWNSVVTLGA